MRRNARLLRDRPRYFIPETLFSAGDGFGSVLAGIPVAGRVRSPLVYLEFRRGARQNLDKHSFVLLFGGLFRGLVSAPGGAEEFKAGLNSANDCGSLHNWSPHRLAQARSRFFDGFHGACQNLIDMNELQTQ